MHTCYSPVRQSPAGEASFSPAALRLACVKPAASVHPEPGSNSPLLYLVSFFLHKIFSATLRKEGAYVLFVLTRTSLYSWLRNRTETYVSLVSISQHSSRMSLLVLWQNFIVLFASEAGFRFVIVTVVSRLRLQSYNVFSRCASIVQNYFQKFILSVDIILKFNRINKC